MFQSATNSVIIGQITILILHTALNKINSVRIEYVQFDLLPSDTSVFSFVFFGFRVPERHICTSLFPQVLTEAARPSKVWHYLFIYYC